MNPPDVNPDANPDLNEIFYVPNANLATAIVPGYPVFCYAINWNNNPATVQQEPTWPTGACPNLPQAPIFNGPGAASFDAQTNPGMPPTPRPGRFLRARGGRSRFP